MIIERLLIEDAQFWRLEMLREMSEQLQKGLIQAKRQDCNSINFSIIKNWFS